MSGLIYGKPFLLELGSCSVLDHIPELLRVVYGNGSLLFLTVLNMINKFYYVYVLLSLKDNKFYIGSTNNLKRRLNEHQSGKNISTAKRLPLKLIYFEGHLSKVDAERRENYFKTTKGKVTLRIIIKNSL